VSSLSEVDDDLVWMPTSAIRRDSELRYRGEVLASLEWQSAFRAAAIGRAAEGAWSFQLEGFILRQWINVARVEDGAPIATFDAMPSFNGTLEIKTDPTKADLSRFQWDSNFWLTKWIWSNENDVELARVTRSLSIRPEGTVVLTEEGKACPHLPVLVVLGWYLIALMTDVRLG